MAPRCGDVLPEGHQVGSVHADRLQLLALESGLEIQHVLVIFGDGVIHVVRDWNVLDNVWLDLQFVVEVVEAKVGGEVAHLLVDERLILEVDHPVQGCHLLPGVGLLVVHHEVGHKLLVLHGGELHHISRTCRSPEVDSRTH